MRFEPALLGILVVTLCVTSSPLTKEPIFGRLFGSVTTTNSSSSTSCSDGKNTTAENSSSSGSSSQNSSEASGASKTLIFKFETKTITDFIIKIMKDQPEQASQIEKIFSSIKESIEKKSKSEVEENLVKLATFLNELKEKIHAVDTEFEALLKCIQDLQFVIEANEESILDIDKFFDLVMKSDGKESVKWSLTIKADASNIKLLEIAFSRFTIFGKSFKKTLVQKYLPELKKLLEAKNFKNLIAIYSQFIEYLQQQSVGGTNDGVIFEYVSEVLSIKSDQSIIFNATKILIEAIEKFSSELSGGESHESGGSGDSGGSDESGGSSGSGDLDESGGSGDSGDSSDSGDSNSSSGNSPQNSGISISSLFEFIANISVSSSSEFKIEEYQTLITKILASLKEEKSEWKEYVESLQKKLEAYKSSSVIIKLFISELEKSISSESVDKFELTKLLTDFSDAISIYSSIKNNSSIDFTSLFNGSFSGKEFRQNINKLLTQKFDFAKVVVRSLNRIKIYIRNGTLDEAYRSFNSTKKELDTFAKQNSELKTFVQKIIYLFETIVKIGSKANDTNQKMIQKFIEATAYHITNEYHQTVVDDLKGAFRISNVAILSKGLGKALPQLLSLFEKLSISISKTESSSTGSGHESTGNGSTENGSTESDESSEVIFDKIKSFLKEEEKNLSEEENERSFKMTENIGFTLSDNNSVRKILLKTYLDYAIEFGTDYFVNGKCPC